MFPVAGGILLTWDPTAAAEGYVAAFKKTGDPSWTYRTVHAPVSSIEFSGLDTTAVYDVSVFAYDAHGNEGSAAGLTSLQPGTGPAFSPAALSFGVLPIGGRATASLTIVNPRTSSLTLNTIGITGSQDFTTACGSVVPCCLNTPLTLDPSGRCGFDVTFAPSLVGPQKGTVTAADNAGGNIGFAALAGEGFVPSGGGGGGGGGCFFESLGF
jgi:hypothetical protein